MDIESIKNATLEFVKAHQAWAPFIVAFLAFGESFAVISVVFPATFLMVAIGGLIGASDIAFWPVWAGAAAGASLGDWISYWIGYKLKDTARNIWPLSTHPQMLERGERFFFRYGVWSIFLGRFFGPLRAVVPLVAGMFAMPSLPFQLANVTSAMVWAFVLLAPGFAAFKMMQ
jgi:membrane protein DedA with SNARE-associated domain